MSQKRAAICVLGLGIGMLHARAYSGMANVDLYVCDTSPQRIEQAKSELKVAGAFSTLDDALNSPKVQAVDISLPNNLHASVAVDASKKGKHAFIEKPLATSLAEADWAQSECKRAGTLLAVAENWQFSAANLRAAEMIRSGAIGRVFLIDVRSEMWPIYFGKSTWWFDKKQTGGGVLLSAGVHAIRSMRMLSPSIISTVSAAWANMALGTETEDTCVVTAEFADGSLGTLVASWATPHAEHLFAVHGTDGTILGKRNGSIAVKGNKPQAEEESEVHLEPVDTIREECAVFSQSVINGAVDDRISFARGRADIEVVEAAYRSATNKVRVALPL